MHEVIIPAFFTLFGAGLTYYFQRLNEKRKTHDELGFQIYMRLLELSGAHFWIASREMHAEPASVEQRQRFQDTRLRVADLLRQVDDMPEMRDILSAMFSFRFLNEAARARELDRLLNQIGNRINPRYATALREIDRENQTLSMQDIDEWVRRQRRLEP